LIATIFGSEWKWFLVACFLAIGPISLLRTARFRAILGKEVRSLFSILITTRALNFFLPARTGELFRVFACHRSGGGSKKEITLAVASESLIEVLMFAVITLLAAPAIWPKVPPVLGLAGLLGVMAFQRKWIRPLGYTLFADLSDAAMIGCCLVALGVQRDPAAWCVVLVTINLAMLIPSPGNLGTLEAGAILGLAAVGIDRKTAIVFAVLYRAAHLVPVVLAALWFSSTKSTSLVRVWAFVNRRPSSRRRCAL
jgi:uncharacterized membrane protein YbhN (UPF0104 family)